MSMSRNETLRERVKMSIILELIEFKVRVIYLMYKCVHDMYRYIVHYAYLFIYAYQF